MNIIQRVQRLEDEWEDESLPEYFWVILEENESVEDGIWYDTEKQCKLEYEKLPEDERY